MSKIQSLSQSKKKWRWPLASNQQEVAFLQKKLPNIPHALCKVLTQRGISTYEEAQRFFRPNLERDIIDSFLMKDMEKAIVRIQTAIQYQEKVMIYSDYDVDGTTSAALLSLFFKDKLKHLSCYIPDRFEEGYGISQQGIKKAHEKKINLIIVADCGIRETEKAALAKSLGIDMIICDHHLPSDTLPKVSAILNPKQKDCPYPFKELSGCGVVLKLIQAFCQKENISKNHWKKYLDFVVTSIAADIVPMTGENRLLSFYGLKKWNDWPATPLNVFKENRKKDEVEISDIVFGISPLINAAGRVAHAKDAFDYLTSTTKESAETAYKILINYNQSRKELQDQILMQALEQIQNNPNSKNTSVTIVYGKWHKGVVGIVASKLIEIFHKPTLVLSQEGDIYVGSGRSIGDFDLYKSLKHCTHLLEKFGGHRKAIGLTLKKSNLKSFIQNLTIHINKVLPQENLKEEIRVDTTLPLHEITPRFLRLHAQLAPFGPENMRPIFLAKKLKVKPDTLLLTGNDKSHIKFFTYQSDPSVTYEVIGFGMKAMFDLLKGYENFDMLFSINRYSYQGEVRTSLQARDFAFPTQV